MFEHCFISIRKKNTDEKQAKTKIKIQSEDSEAVESKIIINGLENHPR
jgi:hypothetical protein